MKMSEKAIAMILALCLLSGLAATASAVTFTDAHGNTIELDDTLEAYTGVTLMGAEDAARKEETNLGDLALEAASQGLPYSAETADLCDSFMQASGLRYTVDTAEAFNKGEAYGEKGWFKAASLGRVTIEEVNGQPFDAEATYAVITSNANFNGMDSSYIFAAAAEENEKSTITTAVVRDVVWMYIAGELNSQIGEAYVQPQGRINVR